MFAVFGCGIQARPAQKAGIVSNEPTGIVLARVNVEFGGMTKSA